MKSATERETQVLRFIASFAAQQQVPPTYSEIANHFGFFPNAAKCHVDSLEKKGLIQVVKGRARGIQILKKAKDVL